MDGMTEFTDTFFATSYDTEEEGIEKIKELILERNYPLPEDDSRYRFMKTVRYAEEIKRVDIIYKDGCYRYPPFSLDEHFDGEWY